MPLRVSYPFDERGNTVPYPPLFDDIRKNQGFIDLRGRPASVDEIMEARDSPALRRLLELVADQMSSVISLGCDLGQHSERNSDIKKRRVAGGYVQLAAADLGQWDRDALFRFSKACEAVLREDVDEDRWRVRFELQPVRFTFDDPIDTFSIWVWFFAADSTHARALDSRERLLTSLRRAVRLAAVKAQPSAPGGQ
jgi:hypothetical protein